jgi:hypothetical protein
MIEIWLNTNRATAAESLSFYGQKNMEEINKMSEEYETRITELETNIREKDEELNQLINQLRTIEERKNFLDLDSYSLNIISDKQNWNQLVQHCPINTLYVENEKRDWNELNEISQLDLSIISLGKNWDDLVQDEGRDGVRIRIHRGGRRRDPSGGRRRVLQLPDGQADAGRICGAPGMGIQPVPAGAESPCPGRGGLRLYGGRRMGAGGLQNRPD